MNFNAIPLNFGYTPDHSHIASFAAGLPKTYDASIAKLVADDDGKDVLLYRPLIQCLQKVPALASKWLIQDGSTARLKSFNQGQIGSCVGNAEAMCISITAAIDIVQKGQPEQFQYMCSPEAMYGIGREAGNMLGSGDGCFGSAVAEGETKIGTLWQTKYPSIDLSDYSVSTCKQLGRVGIPKDLKDEAGKHKIVTAYQVKTADEAWSLIGAGNAINQCSDIGFNGQRDSDGAIKKNGSWGHSMAIVGRRTTAAGRKLFLIINSWGDDWTQGPLFEDQPPGSFYADFNTVGQAIGQGDVFVKIDLNGIQRIIDWNNW